jgi:hypothetical protein
MGQDTSKSAAKTGDKLKDDQAGAGAGGTPETGEDHCRCPQSNWYAIFFSHSLVYVFMLAGKALVAFASSQGGARRPLACRENSPWD